MSDRDLPVFLLGESVFTTCLVKHHRVQSLEDHLLRLKQNILDFYFDLDQSESDLIRRVEQYIERSHLENGALRITVFKNDKNELDYSISQRPLQAQPKTLKLKTEYGLRSEKLDTLKIGSYGKELFLKKMAKNNGYDDVLFKDQEYIYETSTSNIFFVKENKLFTPSNNIYKGLMREKILKNNDVSIRPIKAQEMNSFDAAFITNSLYPIRIVGQIDEYCFDQADLSFIKGT